MRNVVAAIPFVVCVASRSANAQEVEVARQPTPDVQIGEPVTVVPQSGTNEPTTTSSSTSPDSFATPFTLPPPPPESSAMQPFLVRPSDESHAAPPDRAMQNEPQRARRSAQHLATAGGVLFGITYGLTVTVGLLVAASSVGATQTEAFVSLIPVAGPFIDAGFTSGAPAAVILVLDGIVQTAGLSMFIGGFLRDRTLAHEPDPNAHRDARFTVLPGAPGTALGLSLHVVTF
jgi:hypothetical protein